MNHSTANFNEAILRAIDLAAFFQNADSAQRNVIKSYLHTCVPELAMTKMSMLEANPSLNADQADKSFTTSVYSTGEEDNFNGATSSTNRILKNRNKKRLKAVRELAACGNDKKIAARRLGVTMRTFYRWLED